MVTNIDGEGVDLTEIDLSQKNPAPEDDNKIYKHNGKGTITLTDGTTTSEDNYYAWDEPQGAWRRLTASENPNFDSALIRDDGKLKFGTDGDYSIRYDSSKNKLVVADEQDSVDALQVTDAGDIEIIGGDLTDGTNVIFDQSNSWVPLSILEANSVTVTAGDGLKGGGTITLGGSSTVNIEPANFAGSFLSDDGSDNLAVNIGRGLEGDGSGNIQFDEDTEYRLTSGLTVTGELSGEGSGARFNMPGGGGDLTESVQGGHGRSARTWNAEFDSANNTWVQPNGSTEPSAIIGMLNADGGGVGTSEGNVGIGVAPASGTDGANITFTDVIHFRESGLVEVPNSDTNSDSISVAGHFKFTGADVGNPVIRTPGSGSDNVRIWDQANGTDIVEWNEGGPVRFPNYEARISAGMTLENDVKININATSNQGSSGGAGAITNIGRLNFQNEEEAQFTESAEIIYDASQGFVFNDIVDLRNANQMKLPSTSSDPTADAGDMWYRSDLD